MSSGKPKSQPVANPTTTQAAVSSGDAAAQEAKKNLKKTTESSGSSILTSGAGILDDTELRKNTLGAGAYNRTSGLG